MTVLEGLGAATIRLGDNHDVSREGVRDNHGTGTVMTSRMLSRLCTLSPGNTSFITVSFPSCEAQISLLFPSSSPRVSPFPYHIPVPLIVPVPAPVQ